MLEWHLQYAIYFDAFPSACLLALSELDNRSEPLTTRDASWIISIDQPTYACSILSSLSVLPQLLHL